MAQIHSASRALLGLGVDSEDDEMNKPENIITGFLPKYFLEIMLSSIISRILHSLKLEGADCPVHYNFSVTFFFGRCYDYIEEMIHKQEPISAVLRLLILLSLTSAGLPKKNFDSIRCVHFYNLYIF